MSQLLPCINCKVSFQEKIALVTEVRFEANNNNIKVNHGSADQKWISIGDISPGYKVNDSVIHVPPPGKGASLGVGVVEAIRSTFGYNQLLVQFAETGEKRWLDWRILASAYPLELRMINGICGNFDNHPERTRLRILSKGLQIWDSNTGAFGRLDIDPLPHQLDVAKKVVSSPQARWLLADDVGLGKTIEVGLIIHALAQRNRCRRVLIVCPSSLTRQWKEEMRFKFSRFFEIYGRDFNPEYPEEIKLRDNVIVSLDLAKRDAHLNLLLQAGNWDVIIFDEAHRLGRSESGEQTERYRLARALSPKAPSFLLLTATPHQGKSKRFRALLELVRPDLYPEIRELEFNPEVIKQLIIRNKKTKVTDAEGNFIFRGHDTVRITAAREEELQAADQALRRYLIGGYKASAANSGTSRGKAIGFVMTTYRKLASSSIAAIELALMRRLDRLRENVNLRVSGDVEIDELEGDDELAQHHLLSSLNTFFDHEIEELQNALAMVRAARGNDTKLNTLISEILGPLFEQGQSVLIFTEYRATQEYLAEQIGYHFPDLGACSYINGSMNLEQKIDSINMFNDGSAQVMISTEAGGEGLNLQESCHVMINYDLPWNPSRLVQRIGRLYRYGQKKRVQVINIQSDDGFDNQALSLMYQRLSTIADEMASISDQTQEGLASEILGELLSQIDMSEILERATTLNINRTEEEIEEAIRVAQQSRTLEEEILQYSNSYSSNIQGGFTNMHMVSFVEGMCSVLGIKIRQKLHRDQTIEVELPDDLIGKWPEFGRRNVIRLSVDHARLQRSDQMIPMDFECNFVRDLASAAQERWEFDGLYTCAAVSGAPQALAVQDILWQGLAGEALEEELFPIALNETYWSKLDHDDLADLLLKKWIARNSVDAKIANAAVVQLHAFIENELVSRSTDDKTPMTTFVYAAAKFQ